jgi:hypothetical protein
MSAFEPGPGRVMKEWPAFAGAPARWLDLAREAYEFVNRASGTTEKNQKMRDARHN